MFKMHSHVMQSYVSYANLVYPSHTLALHVKVCDDILGMHPPAYFLHFR